MFFNAFNTVANDHLELDEDVEEIDLDGELKKFFDNLDLAELIEIKDELNLPKHTPSDILGEREDIFKLLKQTVGNNNTLLDDVERRMLRMETDINYYKDFFLTDEKRYSKIKENRFLLPDQFYLDQDQIEAKLKANETNLPASKFSLASKTYENTYYTGFDEHQFNDLPGGLEALQLLSNVTNKMGFKDTFLKYWMQIIRSEASVAILLDSFWWFYLTYFCENSEHKADAIKFFGRIADSFSALLMSVNPTIRDRFFDNYAKFLSQAIFMAFYQAYPDSRLHFDDTYKQTICNVIYEWVLGVKPMIDSYKKWEINQDLNRSNDIKDLKITSNTEIMQKIGNLEKILNSLGSIKETKTEKSKRFMIEALDDKKKVEHEILHDKIKRYPVDSHVIGEGAVIEKVLFNPKGQSILISHYLKMHNLKEKLETPAHKIIISEIIKQPEPNATTYKDVIQKSFDRSRSFHNEFQKLSLETENEIRRIEKERKKTHEEMVKIRNADISTFSTIIPKPQKRSMSADKEAAPYYQEYDDY